MSGDDEAAAVHADVSLSDMSKDELMKVMREEDDRVKDLQLRLKRAKMETMEKKLRDAELKTFGKREREKLRKIFDAFDSDGSGKIGVDEFKTLSAKLGYDMTEAEAADAVSSINKNDDDGICFDEFLLWWGESSERGGNKGAKLELLKAKLKAEMVAAEIRNQMANNPAVISKGRSRKQTLALHLSIGDTQDAPAKEAPPPTSPVASPRVPTEEEKNAAAESEIKTSFEIVAVPSDPLQLRDEAARLFPDQAHTSLGPGPDGGTEHTITHVAEVVFDMRDNAQDDDIESAVECFNDAFSANDGDDSDDGDPMVGMWGAKAIVSTEGGEKRLRVVAFARVVDDPIRMLCRHFLNNDNPETCGPKLFTIMSLLVQTKQDGEKFLDWDSVTPVLELFDDCSIHAHAKLAAQVSDMIESLLFADILRTALRRPAAARFRENDLVGQTSAAAALRLLEGIELNIKANSTRDAMRQVVDTAAAYPIKVAAQRGTYHEGLLGETEDLKKRLTSNLDDVFKTEVTVPILMAKLLRVVLNLEEYTTAMQSIGTCCRGIRTLHVSHNIMNLKLRIKGFPFFLYMFQEVHRSPPLPPPPLKQPTPTFEHRMSRR